VGVEEAGENGHPVRFDDTVCGGLFGRVQVGETISADQDAAFAPFVQDMLQQDALRLAEGVVQDAVALQDMAALLLEEPAAGGERDVAAAALEEPSAGEFLQFGDVLADSRLADAACSNTLSLKSSNI
jgi:hypothetical protein